MSRTTLRQMLVVVSRRLLWACATASAIAAAACADTPRQAINPVGPSGSTEQGIATGPSSSGAERQVAREVAGRLDGRFDFTRMWGSEWWQFYSDSVATGAVGHFGLATLHTTHIPDLSTGALTEGVFRIVAANGDELQGTYEGSAVYDPERPDVVHGTAAFLVSGGTGRFAGARGHIVATLLETMDDPSWASAKVTWTLAGTITY